MKRFSWIIPIVCVLASACIVFNGCTMWIRAINAADDAAFYRKLPAGFVSKEEHFDREGIQDFTHYCKYYYDSAEPAEQDERYLGVASVGVDEVKSYFDDFRGWMEARHRLDEYDFDDALITPDDRVYIVNKCKDAEPQWFYADYDVFFFDTGTCTLYYIHNNI